MGKAKNRKQKHARREDGMNCRRSNVSIVERKVNANQARFGLLKRATVVILAPRLLLLNIITLGRCKNKNTKIYRNTLPGFACFLVERRENITEKQASI